MTQDKLVRDGKSVKLSVIQENHSLFFLFLAKIIKLLDPMLFQHFNFYYEISSCNRIKSFSHHKQIIIALIGLT